MSTITNPARPDGPKEQDDLILSIIVVIATIVYFGLLLIYHDAITPDAIWRSSADFSALPLAWIVGLTAASLVTYTLLSKIGFPRLAFAMFWIGMCVMFWLMITCVTSVDYDGAKNPYVRAKEASQDSYGQLAVFHDDPRIAPMIRRAKADGRITQGEAYDILHSDAYYAAWADADRARILKNRNAVLSTR